MRSSFWIPLVLVAAVFAGRLCGSEGMDDFVKLAQSAASEEVIMAFIENSKIAYAPTLDEMVYLRDIGVPDTVIMALQKHGEELRLAAVQAAAAPAAPVAPAAPPAEEPVTIAPAPAPAPVPAAPVAEENQPAEQPAEQPVTACRSGYNRDDSAAVRRCNGFNFL